jgi:hypothetical protein
MSAATAVHCGKLTVEDRGAQVMASFARNIGTSTGGPKRRSIGNTTGDEALPVDAIAMQVAILEEAEGPRAAYQLLQNQLKRYGSQEHGIPVALATLERNLIEACCFESQGR